MHCKFYENGFTVTETTETSILGSPTVSNEVNTTYYAKAVFGDRTDAIILLCTTLVFGVIMLI